MGQRILIKYILNPLSKLMGKLNDKQKQMIFIISAVLLFVQYFLHSMSLLTIPYIMKFMIGCLFMGIMILASLKENLKIVHFDKLMVECWLLTGGLIFASAIRFNVDWLSDALIYLVACPVAFVVWGNLEHSKFLKMLSEACIISFIIFIFISFIFYPIAERQYSGLFSNVNGAAEYLVLAFSCILVKSFQTYSSAKKMLYYIMFGVCIALIVYTNSRTGQLATLCTFVFSTILFILKDVQNIKTKIYKYVLPMILAVIVCLPTTVYVIRIANVAGKYTIEIAQNVKSGLQNQDENISSTQTVQENLTGKDKNESIKDKETGVNSFLEFNNQKTETEGKSLDTVSTGRVSIWKTYLNNVKAFGNGIEEKFWVESREQFYSTAHMMPLTYAFRSGWVCAVVYLLFNVLSGIKSIKYALKEKNGYELLPFAVIMAFGVTSMLSSINTPFTYMITMYYYFIQTVLITKVKKREVFENRKCL